MWTKPIHGDNNSSNCRQGSLSKTRKLTYCRNRGNQSLIQNFANKDRGLRAIPACGADFAHAFVESRADQQPIDGY